MVEFRNSTKYCDSRLARQLLSGFHKSAGARQPVLYNRALGSHEKSGPTEGCFPARIRPAFFVMPPSAAATSRAFGGGIRYREDDPMPTPARLSRQGFLLCTAATTLIIVGFLAYEGVLNDIAHAISDLAYEVMRAINRE